MLQRGKVRAGDRWIHHFGMGCTICFCGFDNFYVLFVVAFIILFAVNMVRCTVTFPLEVMGSHEVFMKTTHFFQSLGEQRILSVARILVCFVFDA